MFGKAILILSIIYLICFALIGLISFFTDTRLSNKKMRLIFIAFSFSMAIVAFYSTDGNTGTSGWDLNRYYARIDSMRSLNLSGAWDLDIYSQTPVAFMLFFFVSRLDCNYWLQFISTLVSLLCISYIICDLQKRKNYKYSTIFLSLMLLFSIFSFATVMLGVRNGMAVCIFALGSYIDSKNNNYFSIKSTVLFLIAVLVHEEILVFLIIKVISMFKFRKINYLLLLWTVVIPLIGYFNFNIEILQVAYDKLLTYQAIKYEDIRVFIVEISVNLILMYILFFNNNSGSKNLLTDGVINKGLVFKKNLSLVVLGSMSIYHLFTRATASILLFSIEDILDVIEKKQKILIGLLFFIACGMLLYQAKFIATCWLLRPF